MNLVELLQRILDQIEEEQLLTRRAALFFAPPMLLVLMALTALLVRGLWEFVAGAIGVMTLVIQFEFFTRPTLTRINQMIRDVELYLPREEIDQQRNPGQSPTSVQADHNAPRQSRISHLRLFLPSLLSVLCGLALFTPALLGGMALWQQVVGLALGAGLLVVFGERLLRMQRLLDRAWARFAAELSHQRGARQPDASAARPQRTDGLLDPALLARLDAQPLPLLRLSPAAQSLVRTEAYLLLRDTPAITDADLREAMQAWAAQSHADELDHWVLPAVGGKVYLPCAAHGLLARALGATARRLGMDGAYSASLGTWLVRLPPARSYAVAARLIDALMALGMLPPGYTLIHHLTVAGDLGAESTVPALLHLLATPLLFEERPGHAGGDERAFIMRGGGVMDDLDRGLRTTGPRTDFVDGFLFVEAPGMDAVEQLAAHAINLRLKQMLAWAIYAAGRPPERRTPFEEQAALSYARLRDDLAGFLTRYDLQGALAIPWLDGRWSEQWPYLQAMSACKQRDPDFLQVAQIMRDTALTNIEALALRAGGQGRRAA